MLFNSLEFIFFFPIVVALYFALNPKYRWIMLLLASYYFYMCWNYKYVVLILFTTTVNYFAGMGIGTTSSKFRKNLYLVLGVSSSLLVLFFFKYFNFFGDSVNYLFSRFNIFYRIPAYDVLLPVGISFFTFQTLSYTIDIYFGKEKVEYHFGIFALFVSFFPQLVAGPIERSTNLLPQFKKENKLSYNNIRDGLVFILWGYFKKVVIADRLSEYVNIVYNNPESFGGWHNIIATLFFSFQIYCDFSGYSDIAIGTAKMMSIDLMTNFRRPYFAMNIREFWKRWHISLSTWFKDYFYIPLGGNRVSRSRMYFNLFVTFLLSGLWHGANWTFVIWGALHGFYLIFAIWTRNIREKINQTIGLTKHPNFHKFWQICITFLLVYFAWIFFRANSLSDAVLIIKRTFDFTMSTDLNLYRISSEFYIAIASIIFLFITELMIEYFHLTDKIKLMPRVIKYAMLMIMLASIFVIGVWEEVDFLYFQF
ncbi:MAG: MBOAT family protein [Bacteroidales bacterium]|nr:MBOAT family protein [Bacteroidales bacterium]